MTDQDHSTCSTDVNITPAAVRLIVTGLVPVLRPVHHFQYAHLP